MQFFRQQQRRLSKPLLVLGGAQHFRHYQYSQQINNVLLLRALVTVVPNKPIIIHIPLIHSFRGFSDEAASTAPAPASSFSPTSSSSSSSSSSSVTATVEGIATATSTATVPKQQHWRKRQLDKIERKFQKQEKKQKEEVCLQIDNEDDLQPMWKEMEGRVTKRKLRTLQDTRGKTGRMNVTKTDEDVWLQEGLYNNYDDDNVNDNDDTKANK